MTGGVLVIGISVVDFVFSVDTLPDRPMKYRSNAAEVVGGGCAGNAAVAIARLGGQARLGSRLGVDQVGALIINDLVADGVDISLVQRTKGAKSSFSAVLVDAKGERQIVNYRGDNLAADTAWIEEATRADAVLVDTRWVEGGMAALKMARDWGVPGVVDAEAPADPDLLMRASHVAFSKQGLLSFVGSNDLFAGLRSAADQLPGWLCVTDGENGTYYLEGEKVLNFPAFDVPVRDTLGAGDIWHGAFTLRLSEGATEVEAVRFASGAAAIKCMTFGGRMGCPDRSTLENFLLEKEQ